MLEMVVIVLEQQLRIMYRFYPNFARSIALLEETIKSFGEKRNTAI